VLESSGDVARMHIKQWVSRAERMLGGAGVERLMMTTTTA
jgi:hypothetical protein